MKFLLAAVFLRLTFTSALERMPEEDLDLILIDSPWEDTIEDSNHGERFERNAEGSGASDWDYGIDDEDHGEADSSPDLVSSRTINHKPFVTKRLEKIALTAGKASRIIIPADTFQDLEDGDARDLVLKVVQFGTGYPMDDLGWIKFNPEEHEIIALPLEAEIGEYEFQVIATDKGGMFERELLQIVVRQHSGVRNFHHSFEACLTMGSLNNFKHDIDWKLAILDDVVGYFGDLDPSSITVLSNRRRGGDVQFVWTNDTLSHQSCPKDSIEAIYGKMVNRKSGDVTPGFKSALKKNFYVKKVSLKMKGLCSTRGGGGVDTGLVTPRLPQSPFH